MNYCKCGRTLDASRSYNLETNTICSGCHEMYGLSAKGRGPNIIDLCKCETTYEKKTVDALERIANVLEWYQSWNGTPGKY